MPKLHGLFGTMTDPFRAWPVTWSVDPADVHRAKARCESEQAALVKELEVVWDRIELLTKPERDTWSTKFRKYVRTRNFEELTTVYQRDREKLEAEEHAINARFTESMLDALFPTGNDGFVPEVKYEIWALPEDQRADLSPGELTLMRAKLHLSADADGTPIDESEDDDDA